MKSKYRCTMLVLILSLSVFTSCVSNRNLQESSHVNNYELVLEDNFEGNAYDTKLWSAYKTQNGNAPWNRFVVDDAALAEVKNGHLYMRARWNSNSNIPETGAIHSKNKFSFTYGKIEVRAKFTKAGQGGWPAIWLMPQNPIYSGWPGGGEIDIMERLNTDHFVHQVVHQNNSSFEHISTGKTSLILTTGYNRYCIVKMPKRIEFYINDVLIMVHEPKGDFAKQWPFETDYYIILNHACSDNGGSGLQFWPGPVTSTKDLPYEMAVDYVKVWKAIEK